MKENPEFNILFVSKVQQFPCLYDNTSLDYSNKSLQLKAWETIASQVNESVIDCKDRWKNLRGCFTRHLKNKSEESSGHRYRKPYYLAKHLNFLLPFTKSRLLVSNEMCDSVKNEDDDTMVDEDGDDFNSNNSNAHEVNGDEVLEDYEEPYLNGEKHETDESRASLAKRAFKTELFADANAKWQNNFSKRIRLERQRMETVNQSDVWNKKYLESLLYSNSDRLVIKTNEKGKNPYIWSQFQIAYIDGIEQKYACCKFCKTFIKYSGRTGTGGLMRHLCFKKMDSVKRQKKRKQKPNAGKPNDNVKLKKNTWARVHLESLVQRNSSRIGYVRNAKGKSRIWSQFRILTVDNILSKFACCMVCHNIVTYTGRTGTGSMMRHKCKSSRYCRELESDGQQVTDEIPLGVVIKSEGSYEWEEKQQPEANNWFGLDEDNKDIVQEENGIPMEAARGLHQRHMALLNKSLRLFDIFENEEFLDFAQYLVNLGAQYGPIDVKDIFKRKMNLVTVDDNE